MKGGETVYSSVDERLGPLKVKENLRAAEHQQLVRKATERQRRERHKKVMKRIDKIVAMIFQL